jgi:hypothetical protein
MTCRVERCAPADYVWLASLVGLRRQKGIEKMSDRESPVGKEVIEAAISSIEGSLRTIDTWVLIFAGAVALSLTVEVVFSVAHWLKDRQLSPLRAELARLQSVDSLKLEADVADARDRAAKSELALEKFRQPRLPTTEQLASLIEKIKPFAGVKFDVAHARVDREAWDFLWRLEPAISAAGWVHIDRRTQGNRD